jgi:hypothetical protein
MPPLSAYGKSFRDAAKNKYTEVAVIVLVGVFIMTIGIPAIPVLGIPNITAVWIGIAIVFYGFYSFLPSAQAILDKARTGYDWACPYSVHAPGFVQQFGVQYCERDVEYEPAPLNHPPHCHGYGAGIPPHSDTAMTPGRTILEMDGNIFGILYLKSFLKVLAISFAALEFAGPPISTFPFHNIIIPIIFLFAMYFRMPTSYKPNEPYKVIESWFRMFIGLVLSILVMYFLTPNPSQAFALNFWLPFAFVLGFVIILGYATAFAPGNVSIKAAVGIFAMTIALPLISSAFPAFRDMPSVAVCYLMLAFFVTMPERKATEEGDEGFQIGTMNKIVPGQTDRTWAEQKIFNAYEALNDRKTDLDLVGNFIFLSFALAGGIPVFFWAAGGASLKIAYGLVWGLAVFMGWVSGRESRPPLGVVVLMLTIISFSFAYSSTVGTAVFGAYWGTVQHTGEVFFGPIAQQMDRASCDAYANYQCISSDPITCKNAKLECQKKISILEGSDKSIEITSFMPAPKEIGLDASGHVANTTVYMTIENTGDYVAQDVKLYVAGSKDGYPQFKYVENRETTKQIGDTEVQSCLGDGYLDGNTCQWLGNFKPGSKGVINFVIDWTSNNSEDQFPSDIKDWTFYYGLYPQIKITTSFDYHVDSQYPSHVRSSEEMTKLLQAGGDEAGTVSRYTGGPMIASIWMPQYVESGKTTFLTAALTNNKEGTATAASTCLYVPKWAGELTLSSTSGKTMEGAPDCAKPADDMNVVECYWDKISSVTTFKKTKSAGGLMTTSTGEPDNSGDCTFKLTPDSGGVPNKEILIIGNTTFHYAIDEIRKSIPITG